MNEVNGLSLKTSLLQLHFNYNDKDSYEGTPSVKVMIDKVLARWTLARAFVCAVESFDLYQP